MDKIFMLFAQTACQPKESVFGLPTWYKYLPGVNTTEADSGLTVCTAKISAIGDVWLVAAAVLEMLIRLAALAAIGMIVWGGIQYIMSQDQPDKTKKALGTIINALIGLVIAVAATTLITFIAGRF